MLLVAINADFFVRNIEEIQQKDSFYVLNLRFFHIYQSCVHKCISLNLKDD